MTLALTPLDDRPSTFEAIAALHRQLVPEPWTPDEARAQLTSAARGHGQHARLAWRQGTLVGAVGWVALGDDGQCYGSPLLAIDLEAATALVEALEAAAADHDAAWVRVSVWPDETPKRRALARAGYTPRFDFITLERPLDDLPPDALEAWRPPAGAAWLPARDADPAPWAALSNRAFASVANSPQEPVEVVAEALADPGLLPEGSGALLDDQGRYLGFVMTSRQGVVEAIGIAPEAQRRGLGTALFARGLAALRHADHLHARTLVASTNAPSLALHAHMGFTERSRFAAWQRDLR